MAKSKEIDLGVAFPFGFSHQGSFSIENTCYYPFPYSRTRSRIGRIIDKWKFAIEPEDEIEYYLSIIEQFRPDIIHIFGSERSFGLIVKRCGVPVILQIQGNLTICSMKWTTGISLSQMLRYSDKMNLLLGYSIFHEYYLLRKRSIREQKILKECKFIIGRTDWDRRITKIFAPQSIYYYCDELIREEFYNKRWEYQKNNKTIIISTLSPIAYKGLEVVLMAASLLKETKKIDFEWQIAGVKGSEELIKIIERSKRMKFKDTNVKFKGSMDANRLAETLLNSSCYVHPSHIENSPNSVCEAMIIGLPIIATYAGGIPSIVKDRSEGILVQDGDPYALSGAILELLESPADMKLFSENAKKKALKRHNPVKIVEEMTSIYRMVLDSSLPRDQQKIDN